MSLLLLAQVTLTPLVAPAVSEPLLCPTTIVQSFTLRDWDSTDRVVYNTINFYCRKSGKGYYGRRLVRNDDHNYQYYCGPKSDCIGDKDYGNKIQTPN